MALLVLSLILFLGVHLIRVVVPAFRQAMIDGIGKPAWMAIHSVASILTLIFVIYAFGVARSEPIGLLYNPPVGMAHLTVTLMLIAVICLVAGFLPGGYIKTKTKHPIVLSVKIWALAHLLSNGEAYSVLLFTAFLIWGVVLRISLKRRQQRGEITLPTFVSAKYDLYAVIIGAIVWVLMIWRVHEWLIGVAPLPMLAS
ncbi:putative membrane protein [Rhizobium sp. BK275]|uniref:NnrU family protein n=1 Tax=Rhizobium sp. BK275 TaxID=2587077 RepID=UPI0016111223|nr:NnrU family protein [Rhizobium sp. BK275]MBB3390254.1 putative membrane protein [Rhizobium sp. BK275]